MSAKADAAPPIMVRARITADEWKQLRKHSLDVNTSTADLIGDLIRSYLNEWKQLRKHSLDVNTSTSDLIGDLIRSYLKKGQR